MAGEFEAKLNLIKKLQGSDLEKALKTSRTELDKLPISTVKKAQFGETLAALRKAYDEAEKAVKAVQLKQVTTSISMDFDEIMHRLSTS